MRKIIILATMFLLVGCGKSEIKQPETFAHSFVETIEVETIHVEEITFENSDKVTRWD